MITESKTFRDKRERDWQVYYSYVEAKPGYFSSSYGNWIPEKLEEYVIECAEVELQTLSAKKRKWVTVEPDVVVRYLGDDLDFSDV